MPVYKCYSQVGTVPESDPKRFTITTSTGQTWYCIESDVQENQADDPLKSMTEFLQNPMQARMERNVACPDRESLGRILEGRTGMEPMEAARVIRSLGWEVGWTFSTETRP